MKKDENHIVALIPAYLDDELSAKKRASVDEHLITCQACTGELSRFKNLFQAFKEEAVIQPSDKLRDNFLEALEKEKRAQVNVVSINESKKGSSWTSSFLRIAAGIALLVGAFVLGSYQQKQKSDRDIALLETESLTMKQTAMLSLMDNQSARKRIQGVNFINQFESPDESIIKALTDRMLFDQNTNVRLTAVDALSRFSRSETVTSAFIEALATEKNPSVQIAIIENLVRIQESKATVPMRKLMEREDTQPFVKEEINRVLSEII